MDIRGDASLPPDSHSLTADEVRDRFRWASRQGNPQWLWPDVPQSEWAGALGRIETLVRDVMTDGGSAHRLDGHAGAIGIAGYTSGMGPLLGYWVETGTIACEKPIAELLALHLRHNRLRMERMSARAAKVSAALAREGIAHTLLKGMHTAYGYFPEPGTRPLTDIDLVIAPDDEPMASQVLRASGFSPGPARTWPPVRTWHMAGSPDQPGSLSLTHADDPWSIDLHTSLNRRFSAGSPLLRLDDAVPENCRVGSAVFPDAQVLGQPLLLLHLAAHASYGLDSLSMTRLVEIALVIRKDSAAGSLSWDAFVGAAKRAEALGCIYPALRLCEQLVPGTIPDKVADRSRGEVPPLVRRIVDPLTPATAQRLVRCSLAERYMWCPTLRSIARQILRDVLPTGLASITKPSGISTLMATYRARMWRLARGTITR